MELPGFADVQLLSRGTNGDHYLATKDGSSDVFVIRTYSIDHEADRAVFVQKLTHWQGHGHPNLCEISDIGQQDSTVYFAMPYYQGGSLSNKLAQGMTLEEFLRAAEQVCLGLAYLHQQRAVHGDVKPNNIVFDGQGNAILIDGCNLTPHPLISIGTPGYVAPEINTASDLSPEADIYSLGMVFVRVLHGELPWVTESSEFPRSRETTDTLPSLTPEFSAFAGPIERLVAYYPTERYGSVEEFQQDLIALDVQGALYTQAAASDLISTYELAEVLPTLVSSTESYETQTWRSRGSTILSWVVVCSVVFSGVWSMANVVYERPNTKRFLADLGWVENVALVEAKLNADTLAIDTKQNLQSILAAYEAVLAIDPNDAEALAAIEVTRTRWESEFESALLLNELNVAQNRLNELLAVYAGEPRVVALVEQLEVRRHALRLQTDTLGLLQARGPYSATSADMALNAFNEVLRLYPSSADARSELNELAAYYSQQAMLEVESGDIQAAMVALNKATRANPEFEALPDVRVRIQNETSLQAEINARLADARSLQLSGNLIEPDEQNAALLFHSVLTTDPDNEVALQGLSAVSESVVQQFDTHLQDRDFGAVRRIIERSKNVGLYPASIMHMESSMADELNTIAEAADFIVEAERFMTQGFITEPSDNNAVIALRRAHDLNASNPQATELYRQCIERLKAVAQDARSFGLTEIASEYSQVALQLESSGLR